MGKEESKEKSPTSIYLEWVKALSTAAATILIPVAIAFVGNSFSQTTKEREIEARFVELSIEILREPPSGDSENPSAIRNWAIDVINKYSGVELTREARDELQNLPLAIYSGSLGSRTLRLFDQGTDVLELQRVLSDLGFFTEAIDGVFGNATQAALRRFQRTNGLSVDGVGGSSTLQLLQEKHQEIRQGSSTEENTP